MLVDSLKKAGLLLTLALAGVAGCGDDPEEGTKAACGFEDPGCLGCAQLGACCVASVNCPVATICNLPTDPLYDADQETGICLKVTCDSDADCDNGKVCSLEKLCKTPVCQVDADCTGGEICLGGACATAPDASEVAACEVVTPSGVIAEGGTLALTAVAKNASGKVLPGIGFAWSSSDEAVVSVADAIATGGSSNGSATLSASVLGGNTTCTGAVELSNYAAVGSNDVRVVAVVDGTGAPLADASVIVVDSADSQATQTTDATGAAVFSGLTNAVTSVSVLKDGYEIVTVVEPGTRNVFVPVPAATRPDTAGGFRGLVDISETKRGDIQLGFVGPALPTNLLDFGLDALIGDSISTEISAPELSLELTGEDAADLPGGLLAALAGNRFMSDGSGPRCQGATVSTGQLGCFLARAPEGRTAGWALAGQLKLKDITPIISTVSDVVGGDGDIPVGDVLVAVLPLLRNLNHAIVASLDIDYAPMIDGVADYSKYQRVDLSASQELGVLSVINVPNLPGPSGDCADAAIILGGAILEGRGLVPLGVTAGLDVVETGGTPDCKVDGVPEAFGSGSADTANGQMALSMAPLHSGAEGSDTFLLIVAADSDKLLGDAGLQATALVERTPNGVQPTQSISGSYLDIPTGSVRPGQISLGAAVSGATLNRYELQNEGVTWLVYAPSTTTQVSLPTLDGVSGFDALTDAYILSMKMDGSFSDAFELGSGKTLDKLIETVEAFSVQQCVEADDAGCQLTTAN